VTEIGEKEKMKNKLLAIAIAFVLMISVFPAFNIRPAISGADYVYMTIAYNPSIMTPAPELVPEAGTHEYPKMSKIQLTAPLTVLGTGSYQGWRWDFANWTKTNSTDGTFIAYTTDAHFETSAQDYNYTYTAYYDTSFMVTVNVPADQRWTENFTAYIYYGGLKTFGNESYSMYVPNGTSMHVGIGSSGLGYGYGEPAMPIVWVDAFYKVCARFVNWTVAGGYSHTDSPPPEYIAWSKPVTITEPKTFVPDWEFVYKLEVSSTYDVPPVTGFTGYYPANYNVTLSETTVYGLVDHIWVPDYWTVDGVKVPLNTTGTPSCVTYCSYFYDYSAIYWPIIYNTTIVVKMDTNHTAILHYKLQWWVRFDDKYEYIDHPGWSCVSTQTGWYDAYSVHTFTAPQQYTNITSDSRYRFFYWQNVTQGGTFGNLTERSFSLNVTQSMHFTAWYLEQWLVQVFTKPADTGLLGKTFLRGGIMITGSSGWFDDCAWGATPYSRAYFGAPKSYGYIEWNNGTGLNFTEWQYDAGAHYSYDNNTSWNVWRAINFTAVYQKYYRVTLSAVFDSNPIPDSGVFSWQGDSWYPEDGGTWIYPYTAPTMYVDPANWVWLFDYWETAPYGNLAWWPGGLYLDMNTTYTAIAHYRLATGLVVDPRIHTFETAGNAYCRTFKVTIYATNVKELYSVKAKLTYDPKYLEIVGIDPTPLTSLGWFVADWDWVNDGSYELVASAIGNDTNGLTGGAIKLVVITFHIIYEPCLKPDPVVPLNLDVTRGGFFHKNMTGIPIEALLGSTYYLKVLMPELMGYATFTNAGKSVVIDVYAVNVTKLHDYSFKLFYNTAELSLKSYEVITTFFPGPGLYTVSTSLGANWFSITVTETSGYLANGTGPIVRLVFDVIVPGSAVSAVKFDPENSYISEKCDLGIVYLWKWPWYPTSPSPPNYDFLSLDDMTMPPPLPGDANLDGVVDIFDLRLVAYYMDKWIKPGGPAPPSCDVYGGDSYVNIYDLIWVAIHIS
jgi:hypothetical protein